jgi:hypothetical protein
MKTAVEWLLDQLENQVSDDGKQTMSLKVTGFLREQAKEMERQQIVLAYEKAMETDVYNTPLKIGLDYYNETFKKK